MPQERFKIGQWNTPANDKYPKMMQAMQEAKFPSSLEGAVSRVRNSIKAIGFAFLAYILFGNDKL